MFMHAIYSKQRLMHYKPLVRVSNDGDDHDEGEEEEGQ